MLLIELPALQVSYVYPFQNQGACSNRQPSTVVHFAIPLLSFLNHLSLPFHSGHRRCPRRPLQNHAPSCSRLRQDRVPSCSQPLQNVAQRLWSIDLSFPRSKVSFSVVYPSALSCRLLYHIPRLGNPLQRGVASTGLIHLPHAGHRSLLVFGGVGYGGFGGEEHRCG